MELAGSLPYQQQPALGPILTKLNAVQTHPSYIFIPPNYV
jgi:hypothetical protein